MEVWKDKLKRKTYKGQRRQLKAVKRRKKWLNNKRKSLQGKSAKQREFLITKSQAVPIKAPLEFSIKRKPNEAFKFIAILKSLKLRSDIKGVFISLRECIYISSGAIALMISAIAELKAVGIKVSGDYPIDKSARTILEKSGFFNFVIGYVSDENKITLNTILQQGVNVVDAAAVAPLVLKSMQVVWGTPYRNPRLQSLLIELMANTVNHAFERNKTSKWYLSISSDEVSKKVSFTFIDNGLGINRTLMIKFLDKIKALLLNTNESILRAAFEGKFGSRTKEKKRGRGLPSIKKCFAENCIRNLVVITNDVYLDFNLNESRKLVNSFDGTCYYWELRTMENFIKISKDFSPTPGARYKSDGDFSGEEFYESILKKKFENALRQKQILTIDLDGTYGFATSFLNEAFNRLAIDFGPDVAWKNIQIISSEEPYLIDEIKEYIYDAQATN